jgi:P pilus assembly chaperone PapD
MKRVIAPFLMLILLVVGLSGRAAAQDGAAAQQSALAVRPAILEHVLEPGVPVPFQIAVSNTTNFPLPIKSAVRDFTVLAELLEKPDQDRLNASAWFAIDEPDFILQPNQTRTVKGIIAPPTDATPGGHYATVYFQPLIPYEALSPSTAYLNSRLGVLAMLVVKGDIIQTAEYSRSLQTSGVIQHGPAEFVFSIRNTGNVHSMPTGKLIIYNRSGKEVDHIDLPAGIVLPNSDKEYKLSWPAPNAFGKYRAELQLTYGSDQASLPQSQATFWVVPWGNMVAGLIGAAATGLFIYKTRRRWDRAWHALRGKKIYIGR